MTEPPAESVGIPLGSGADADAPDDSESDGGVEPVELLVQLAEDGEIDPWDIDVVRVTEEFLDALDDADIRAGGRALFYASVLLRMKSDAMLEDDEEEEEPPAWDADFGPADGEPPEPSGDPVAALEDEMDRRIERKRARGTPQTLDELVRDLRQRERESYWKPSRSYDTTDSPKGFARGTQTLDYHGDDAARMEREPTAEEVTERTHDEQIDEIVNDVYIELQRQYDAGREEVLFREISSIGGSTVDTFLGLLFLSHRGRVRLRQDEFFGDLWIADPAAVGDGETATADD
ncbi:MAG: ScpA family protein [Natronomonas sp.]